MKSPFPERVTLHNGKSHEDFSQPDLLISHRWTRDLYRGHSCFYRRYVFLHYHIISRRPCELLSLPGSTRVPTVCTFRILSTVTLIVFIVSTTECLIPEGSMDPSIKSERRHFCRTHKVGTENLPPNGHLVQAL